MQDDLDYGAKYLIQQGLVDKEMACLGGYMVHYYSIVSKL